MYTEINIYNNVLLAVVIDVPSVSKSYLFIHG